MNVEAIKAAWAEWDAASAATDAAFAKGKPLGAFSSRRANSKTAWGAYKDWTATLERTDAAREAVAGLPDLDEVAAWEAEQAAIAEAEEKQGKLF
jgi:hypothetical protein